MQPNLRGQTGSGDGDALHGTINVVFANAHGVVALTDSRLSSGGKRTDFEGRKLFRIDEHTVCTIAGWYANTGPSLDGKSSPAAITVGEAMNLFLHELGVQRMSIVEKARYIAHILALSLSVSESVSDSSGRKDASPSDSILTVAGIESGLPTIVQTRLTPKRDGKTWIFDEGLPNIQTYKDHLIYAIAGIDTVATPFLQRAGTTEPEAVYAGERSEILSLYRESMQKDRGSNIALSDLKLTAQSLELLTSQLDPEEVGGSVQSAVLDRQNGMEFEQPVAEAPVLKSYPKAFTIFRGHRV